MLEFFGVDKSLFQMSVLQTLDDMPFVLILHYFRRLLNTCITSHAHIKSFQVLLSQMTAIVLSAIAMLDSDPPAPNKPLPFQRYSDAQYRGFA